MTIGRYSSEGSDRSASKGDYYLSDAETELLTRVAAKFKKTVVVLNVGAVLDTEWIKDIPGIDSVLMAWQAGMEGGLATADVLVGDVNPSGIRNSRCRNHIFSVYFDVYIVCFKSCVG